MKKSSRLYILIIGFWISLLSVTVVPFWHEIYQSDHRGLAVASLVTLSTLFVSYFWLNGTKDLIYVLFYYRRRGHFELPPNGYFRELNGSTAKWRVAMVYCTYNDFNAESLEKSMHQDYPKHTVVILDDSTDDAYKHEIDAFAQHYGVEVVRRDDHVGFKAGNLNNYLRKADYDFFVILDSDEIVPSNFITRSLDYFAYYPNAGIVQANHLATRNRNHFMQLFAIGVNSHWPTYQTAKHYYGFLSLLGHGAMVRRDCYFAAGGFPHLVAEDLCMSIEARNKGLYTAFAPDIMCEEEYPIDYLAFKKRHSKWTQGNMEFIKRYTWRILRSSMTWYEKLDIILFTYSLPLSAFFALYVIINVVVLPVLHYHIVYPLWMLAPTVVFLVSPMLNDIIYHGPRIGTRRLVHYLAHSMLLYGSMLFISLRSSIKSTFGRSVFIVTPKTKRDLTFRDAVLVNRGEIIFGISVLIIAIIFDKTPLPTLLVAIPALLSVYLARLANEERKKSEQTLTTAKQLRRQQLPVAYSEHLGGVLSTGAVGRVKAS
ncbi:MAG TPA: glycosyltransferase family 2 protein [Verrucomicrobiae bacterium]|nr:glycosyltransferase family 2 protein [Verrucomicrobiae bacterium]